MGNIKGQLRQGDVLLTPVRGHVHMGASIRQEKNRLVLALGEATGHAHVIEDETTEMTRYAGRRFLKVTKTAVLTHEEHAPVTVPPGEYEIIMQRQVDPKNYQQVERRTIYD